MKSKAVTLGSLIEDALALVLQGSSDDEDNTELGRLANPRGEDTRMCRPFGRHYPRQHPHRHIRHGEERLYYPRRDDECHQYDAQVEDPRYDEREPLDRYPTYLEERAIVEDSSYYQDRNIPHDSIDRDVPVVRKSKRTKDATKKRKEKEPAEIVPAKIEPEDIPGSITVKKHVPVAMKKRFMAQEHIHGKPDVTPSLESTDDSSSRRSSKASSLLTRKKKNRNDGRKNRRSGQVARGRSESPTRGNREAYDQREDDDTIDRQRIMEPNRASSRPRSSSMDHLPKDTRFQDDRLYEMERREHAYDPREVYEPRNRSSERATKRPSSRPRGRRASNMRPLPEDSSFQDDHYDVMEQREDVYEHREVYEARNRPSKNKNVSRRPSSRQRGMRPSNMDLQQEESSFDRADVYEMGQDHPEDAYRRPRLGRTRSETRFHRYNYDYEDDSQFEDARPYKHSSSYSVRGGSVGTRSTVVAKSRSCLGLR